MTRGEAGVQPEGTLAITKSVTADLHASTNSGRRTLAQSQRPAARRKARARPCGNAVAAGHDQDAGEGAQGMFSGSYDPGRAGQGLEGRSTCGADADQSDARTVH